MFIRTIIAYILLSLGAFMYISEIIGLFKFKSTLNKMHATALGSTLGLIFSIVGILILKGWSLTSLKLILIPVFVCITSPVTSHLFAKTEYMYFGKESNNYSEEEC